MKKSDVLRMINNLENRLEKSKILVYDKTDSLIERLNAVHDQQDEIEKVASEIDCIYKAFESFLNTLKIE